MHFRPERTISRKVLVRYPMALPFPLLHLGMEGVHVVQVVVFVVALPSYQLLRSTSLLLDQPVVAVGAVCPEECSAAEMVGYVLHVNLRRLSHVVYLGKGRSIPRYAGKGADECRLSPSSLPESLSSWVLHPTISFPLGTCGSISRPVRFCQKA